MTTTFDVIIAGAGPVGLSFAASMASDGLRVALIDRQELRSLAIPTFDGREIALTLASERVLRKLGAWPHLQPDEISPLRAARVRNGGAEATLALHAAGRRSSAMASLVPNHHIRAALFKATIQHSGLEMFAGRTVSDVRADQTAVRVALSDGTILGGQLLVAADSRLSPLRATLGIGAEIHETGRSILTFRVSHETDHHQVALEWFDHHRTVALLPLNGRMSSIVLTLPTAEAERLATMGEGELGAQIAQDRGLRLGKIRVASSRHVYPLVITYARNFVKPRAALIGDAAVGMHPVTAHGFNFGLSGQQTLATAVLAARHRNEDIGGSSVLRLFEVLHRRNTRPLYLATNALVRLYTDETAAGRLARQAVLHAGRYLPFAQAAVSAVLTAS